MQAGSPVVEDEGYLSHHRHSTHFSYSGNGDDQRSFLSNIEVGSQIYSPEDDHSDVASVSTSRSLPSTLSSCRPLMTKNHSTTGCMKSINGGYLQHPHQQEVVMKMNMKTI